MSAEATLRVSLTIKQGNLDHRSNPTGFSADVAVGIGPSPGSFIATTAGTNVDFSKLVTPGLCTIQNLDDTNYVQYGIKDPVTNVFYPLGEVLPGEIYVLRLSRNLLEEYHPSTGTGTTAKVNDFTIKANSAPCVVVVNAFEA